MLSIIICTYNRAKYIRRTLEHLAACPYAVADYEVILINNCSTDSTRLECERFAAEHSDVMFHYFEEQQQGLSFARNRGMREAHGDWFVFLDDDAFVNPDYLTNLAAQLAAHPDAVAFGGRIIPFYEDGTEPAWMSRWTYSWVSALDKGSSISLFGKDYPIGANMGIRRDFAEIVGDFNVELGRTGNNLLGGEEKDYFNRIKRLSNKIYYFPDVEVQHCIPPHRLTHDFIRRLGIGVGQSERKRTLGESNCNLDESKCNLGGRKCILSRTFALRCASETVKWMATIVLFLYFTILLKPQKGYILVLFRLHVSRGLLSLSEGN